MKTILILGSSRRDGNAGKIADYINEEYQIEVIDLNEYKIGYFDYTNKNADDDFIPLMKKIVEYDQIIFLSPVYWYSMSAIMKTFFDRITDLMKWHKDLGRQLRGKRMSAISNGRDDTYHDSFFPVFEKSAKYLGMTYLGGIHSYSEDGNLPELVKKRIASLLE